MRRVDQKDLASKAEFVRDIKGDLFREENVFFHVKFVEQAMGKQTVRKDAGKSSPAKVLKFRHQPSYLANADPHETAVKPDAASESPIGKSRDLRPGKD